VVKEKIRSKYGFDDEELKYLLISDTTSNYAYNLSNDKIAVMAKSGKVSDITELSDHINIEALTRMISKHFICYPKDVDK